MEQKLFLFGIDEAGKTALERTIKTGSPQAETKPTLAFNIDNLVIKDLQFQVFDMPGQKMLRSRWKRGFMNARILMFVVDVADPARFEEAHGVFTETMETFETGNLPLVFCFHKMDKPEATEHLAEARALFKVPRITDREVRVVQSSIHHEDSIQEIKDALVDLMMNTRW